MNKDTAKDTQDKNEIINIQQTLAQFVNVVPKTQQALRLFNNFYQVRFDGYKKLSKKSSWNIFKTREAKAAERAQAVDILRQNNARERKVFLEIYANAYTELKPHIELLKRRWKKESAELAIMQKYFDDVFSIQKEFLEKETLFLDSAIAADAFASFTADYFAKLETISAEITKQYGKFYSPVEFEKNIRTILKDAVAKEADLIGYLVVFVGLFAGVNNFDHAMPEQLIDIEKLPTGPIFAEFVLICYVLTKLNAPVKVWAGIKGFSKQIVESLSIKS